MRVRIEGGKRWQRQALLAFLERMLGAGRVLSTQSNHEDEIVVRNPQYIDSVPGARA